MELLAAKRDWGRVAKAPDALGRYRCSTCRGWKSPAAFAKNKQQKSGLNYACKACMRLSTRKHSLPSKYGITAERFEAMMEAQSGACACCGLVFAQDAPPSGRACVDHNHSSGEVRGILCGRCNLAAGNLGDSSARAEQMAAYLKKWNC